MQRLICVVQHDGPVERTGRDARNKVQREYSNEASRGARESTCASRDGVHLHNSVDIGVLRWSAASCNVSEQRVSVGCCEDTGPDCCVSQEVNLHLIGHGKVTKMSSPSRRVPIHKQ